MRSVRGLQLLITMNGALRREGFHQKNCGKVGKDMHFLCQAGEPHQIAAAVNFLASDEASNITGQALMVDGGLSVTSGS